MLGPMSFADYQTIYPGSGYQDYVLFMQGLGVEPGPQYHPSWGPGGQPPAWGPQHDPSTGRAAWAAGDAGTYAVDGREYGVGAGLVWNSFDPSTVGGASASARWGANRGLGDAIPSPAQTAGVGAVGGAQFVPQQQGMTPAQAAGRISGGPFRTAQYGPSYVPQMGVVSSGTGGQILTPITDSSWSGWGPGIGAGTSTSAGMDANRTAQRVARSQNTNLSREGDRAQAWQQAQQGRMQELARRNEERRDARRESSNAATQEFFGKLGAATGGGTYSNYIGGTGNPLVDPLTQQFQQAMDETNAANETRYGQVLDELGGSRSSVLAQLDAVTQAGQQSGQSLLEGYADRYNRNMDDIRQLGETAISDLNAQYARAEGEAEQNLVSRGLGNTTVRDSVRRGLESDLQKGKQRIEEGLLERRIAADSALSGDLLGTQERLQEREREDAVRRAATEADLTSDVAGAIERRTDLGPSYSDYADLVQGVGASGMGGPAGGVTGGGGYTSGPATVAGNTTPTYTPYTGAAGSPAGSEMSVSQLVNRAKAIGGTHAPNVSLNDGRIQHALQQEIQSLAAGRGGAITSGPLTPENDPKNAGRILLTGPNGEQRWVDRIMSPLGGKTATAGTVQLPGSVTATMPGATTQPASSYTPPKAPAAAPTAPAFQSAYAKNYLATANPQPAAPQAAPQPEFTGEQVRQMRFNHQQYGIPLGTLTKVGTLATQQAVNQTPSGGTNWKVRPGTFFDADPFATTQKIQQDALAQSAASRGAGRIIGQVRDEIRASGTAIPMQQRRDMLNRRLQASGYSGYMRN